MSVTAAAGFVAAGGHAGVKADGGADVAVVATADGSLAPAAAVFTANKMTAAPVVVSHRHLTANGGHAAGVVLNSGNANAATGAAGEEHAERMCAAAGAAIGCRPQDLLVCSTGLIGIPMPIDALVAGIGPVAAGRGSTVAHGAEAAEAIRTTDTYRKEARAQAGAAVVGGMAKGAAMLAPNMATMLAVLTTDAAAEPAVLQRALHAGVEGSFNVLTTDSCTSTNDTVILLASGAAGPVDEAVLAAAVAEVCGTLAAQMAGDAEGATKVVHLEVHGAASNAEAATAARKIAGSQLVKCSWYGCDPYWGRLASEAGSAGVAFEPATLAVSYGGVTVASGGITVAHDEAAVAAHMAGRELRIVVDLGLGSGRARVLTNDLTHAYIDENMGTS